ncbi:hypothetical protein KC347_g228 [Hortaea werneckii]|nr:hypothetical protein KC347_g228 [Hortaea werneckii]
MKDISRGDRLKGKPWSSTRYRLRATAEFLDFALILPLRNWLSTGPLWLAGPVFSCKESMPSLAVYGKPDGELLSQLWKNSLPYVPGRWISGYLSWTDGTDRSRDTALDGFFDQFSSNPPRNWAWPGNSRQIIDDDFLYHYSVNAACHAAYAGEHG